MKTEIIEYIRLASNLSVIIPVVFYVKSFRYFPVQNHIIGMLVVFSGLADWLTYYPNSLAPIIHNIYGISEFLLLTWFFYELVYKKTSEPIALIGIGAYISMLIYSMLTCGLFTSYFSLYSMGSLIIVIHTIVYVFNVPRMTMERFFDSNLLSNMIFSVSIFGYFLLAFFIMAIFLSLKDFDDMRTFWTLHNIFNILKNIGFGLAFYYTGKRKIYMTIEQLERIARKMEEEANP